MKPLYFIITFLFLSGIAFSQKKIIVGTGFNSGGSSGSNYSLPFNGLPTNYLGGDSAFHAIDSGVVILSDTMYYTPNIYAGTGLSDTRKIQLALNLAIANNKKLLIGFNKDRGRNKWMIDSAIMLYSGANIVIQNDTLKLSDSARDNIFRTANCGIGITNPGANPMGNISIVGIGSAVLEGADNPRATGDAGKSLSLTPTVGGTASYGTDAGKAGRSQTGDWRNYGAVFAYSSNVYVSGLELRALHAYGLSFSRCSRITVRDIYENMPGWAADGDTAKVILNCGGLDFNSNIKDVNVENVSGISADDNIAFNISNLTGTGHSAGDSVANYPTGDTTNFATDSIANIYVNNVSCKSYANTIRVLAVGDCIARNISFSNIFNNLTSRDPLYVSNGSGTFATVIIIGSSNISYGGPSTLGKVSNFTIRNARSYNTGFGVWVQGSLSESNIYDVQVLKAGNNTDAVYADTPTTKLRNVSVFNSFPRSRFSLSTRLPGTYGDTVLRVTSSDNVGRTLMTSSGTQKWNINSGTGEIGSVTVGGPFGTPGILFNNTSGTARTEIREYSTSGGLGFGYDAGGTDQMVLSATGLFATGISVTNNVPTSTLQTYGSFATSYKAITSTYTATVNDNTLDCTSGTFTVTLPTAVGITGREYWITNTGSGTITIATTSSQTFTNVSGTPTTLSVPQFSNYKVKSNGTGWLAYKIVN